MSKKVAVIASILKPVDDTRMYEKLGLSMRESNKYHVNIIGFKAKFPPQTNGLSFYTLYNGSRFSIGRLLAPIKFFFKLLKLKPALTVVCTPELLMPAVIYKIAFSTRLWYDVQENYQRNVKYQTVYPDFIKPILLLGIKMIEWLSRPFINHYLLAEKGYSKEMWFVNGNYTILENKYAGKLSYHRKRSTTKTTLVYTGTCSIENGIKEAIFLTNELHRHHYPVLLRITGHIPNNHIQAFIQNKIDIGCPIELIGDGSLLPHSLILETAAQGDFGLVSHQPNPSTENCIPTKIYEYLGMKLPMILHVHPPWESVVEPYQAAIVMDYNRFDPHEIWKRMHHSNFYTRLPGEEISWQKEAEKLLAIL